MLQRLGDHIAACFDRARKAEEREGASRTDDPRSKAEHLETGITPMIGLRLSADKRARSKPGPPVNPTGRRFQRPSGASSTSASIRRSGRGANQNEHRAPRRHHDRDRHRNALGSCDLSGAGIRTTTLKRPQTASSRSGWWRDRKR